MEVVSQLCFAGQNPPSDDVVIKLLSYITVQSKKGWMYSKNMEVIDDAFDRTPVVRSFLLQLLMRTRYSTFIYMSWGNTEPFTPLLYQTFNKSFVKNISKIKNKTTSTHVRLNS